MSKTDWKTASQPMLAAAGMLIAGVASHHLFLGLACAAAASLGLYLRQRPKARLAGNVLFLVGVIAFCAGLWLGRGLPAANTAAPNAQGPTNEA